MTTFAQADASWQEDATVIGLVSLAHASSHFSHLLLPLMFPKFIETFGFSYSELGLLMSVFFVVSGVGQASAGFLVDRLGARPVMYFALGTLALACITVSIAQSYSGLMGAAILFGVGNASFHPVDFTILNQRVSSTRLGYAFSAHGLTGNLGWAVAPLFMVGISSMYDWRTAYVAAACVFICILVLLVCKSDAILTQAVDRSEKDPNAAHSLAFLKIPVVWWCFAFFLLSTMTLAVIQTFSASILQAMYQVSFEAATLTLTAYMLCAAAGMFLGGFVATRWPLHSDRVVATCMSLAAFFTALCGSGWFNGAVTMVILAATGFAVGVGGPSRDMMIKKATPSGATGRVYGMVYSGLDVGFAISPLVFGVFMDRGWYGLTLVGGAFVMLLSVLVALGVGKRSAGKS
ncbi:MAG: MFS transporter [Burkholderiales bacterium]|jgi:MFS family permease|nr:MFS transporter [Burkholderiales bacterium]